MQKREKRKSFDIKYVLTLIIHNFWLYITKFKYCSPN